MRLLRRFTPRNDKRENTLGINGLDCFTPFGRSQWQYSSLPVFQSPGLPVQIINQLASEPVYLLIIMVISYQTNIKNSSLSEWDCYAGLSLLAMAKKREIWTMTENNITYRFHPHLNPPPSRGRRREMGNTTSRKKVRKDLIPLNVKKTRNRKSPFKEKEIRKYDTAFKGGDKKRDSSHIR